MKSYAHWKLGWVLLPLVAAERITHFCEKKTLRWIVVLNWFHARSIHIESCRDRGVECHSMSGELAEVIEKVNRSGRKEESVKQQASEWNGGTVLFFLTSYFLH